MCFVLLRDSEYVSGLKLQTQIRWSQMIGCRPHRKGNSPKEEKKIDDVYYLD